MKYAAAVLAFVAFVNADTGGGGHGHHAPVHHAPVHHAPVHHAPVHHEPVHHAPVHHAPVHHEPAYHAPVHNVHHEPVYHAPAVHHAPSYHAPAHHGPSYAAPSYAPSYGYSGHGGRGALQRGQGFQAQLGRGLRRVEGGTAALIGGWLRGQGYYLNSYGLRDAGDQFIEYGKRVAGPGPFGPDPIPQIIGV